MHFHCLPGLRYVLCGLIVLAGIPIVRADTAVVGDPENPAALPQAILDAHAHGAADITIAPGVYDLPSQNHRETIVFEGWSGATIHASGVTLIFEELAHHPVVFHNCADVTWDGGTLRYARPAYTQGRVVAMGADDKGNYCDWRIDDGYPTVLQSGTNFNIVDPKTRRLKVGTGDWTPFLLDPALAGLIRLHYPAAQDPKFAVNDWLVARAVGGSMVVVHEDCQACTTRNVTLQNAGFGAFFEAGGAGGNRYLNCTVEQGPRSVGATEDELVAGGADGFHSVNTHTGPDIEDCTWSGVFLDDCIAIHGSLFPVLASEGNRLQVNIRGSQLALGDPLRIAGTNGFFAQANITAIEPQKDHTTWVTLDQSLVVPVDLVGASKDKTKGTRASDPRQCGAGYKILRCHLGDTRSRGILVKADDGVIDQCTIDGCGMSGISIGPEFWWGEAGYSWNVVVSNNQFLHCAQTNDGSSTLFVHADGAIGNRDILVKGNSFVGCYGHAIVGVMGADGVEIRGNRFDQSFPLPPYGKGDCHQIYLSRDKNVKLLGNVVTNQGATAGNLVQMDASVKVTDVQNDDPAGIVVSTPTDAVAK